MPFEIQAALERAVMAPFIPDESSKLLQYHADASNMGITYKLTLSFEAALQKSNFYRLDCIASWPQLATINSEVNRKSSTSCLRLDRRFRAIHCYRARHLSAYSL